MKKSAFAIAMAVSFLAAPATATCLVEDAAKAALERELALIEAMAIDPADSFSAGSNSCISTDILSSFDLSSLIPDLSGMLSGFAFDSIDGIIAQAQQQACRAIDDAISDSIGQATSAVTSFNSTLSGDLQNILSNGWSDIGI